MGGLSLPAELCVQKVTNTQAKADIGSSLALHATLLLPLSGPTVFCAFHDLQKAICKSRAGYLGWDVKLQI